MREKEILASLFFTVILIGVSVANSVEVQKNDFFVCIPDGWIEIPKEAIARQEEKLSNAMPNAPVQHLDYGFQLHSSKNWFEYPYILIKIQNTGRIPEAQLAKFDRIPEAQLAKFKGYSAQKIAEQLSPLIKNIQIGKMVYDKQNNIIWMCGEVASRIGPISFISGMIPTEIGYIQMLGYSFKKDYPTYETVFTSAAISVTLVPGIVYKPKWSQRLPSDIKIIDWNKVVGGTGAFW